MAYLFYCLIYSSMEAPIVCIDESHVSAVNPENKERIQ
jgi:hypothetical protein